MKTQGEFQKNEEIIPREHRRIKQTLAPNIRQRAMLLNPQTARERTNSKGMLKCKNEAIKLLKIQGQKEDFHRKGTHWGANQPFL